MAESFSSSWEANCAVKDTTNGVDFKNGAQLAKLTTTKKMKLAKADIVDGTPRQQAVGLPDPFKPSLPALNGSDDVLKSYILPDGKTGVVRLVHFEHA